MVYDVWLVECIYAAFDHYEDYLEFVERDIEL